MAAATSKSKRNQGSTAQADSTVNVIVARRLAFIEDASRKGAAQRFLDGESVANLAEELNLTHTRAAYALRQGAVEMGKVSTIDPSNAKAVKAAQGEDKYSDLAWLACRTGTTPGKVKDILEA